MSNFIGDCIVMCNFYDIAMIFEKSHVTSKSKRDESSEKQIQRERQINVKPSFYFLAG